ncbi:hypothetical protein [Streptomyces virginiae]
MPCAGRHRVQLDRAVALGTAHGPEAGPERRADALTDRAPAGPTPGRAARDALDAATVRSYGRTLRRPTAGGGRGGAAARTWNRHRSTLRPLGSWARPGGLAAGLERRPENRCPAPDPARLDALRNDPDLPLRAHAVAAPVRVGGRARPAAPV